MPLQSDGGTFITSKECCRLLDMAYSTFTNRRTSHGDRFLKAHRDLIPGRVLFRLEDVERLARGRAA